MWGIWLRRMSRRPRLSVFGATIDSSIGYCYSAIEKHCDIIVSKSNLHRTPMYTDKMHPHNLMIFAK